MGEKGVCRVLLIKGSREIAPSSKHDGSGMACIRLGKLGRVLVAFWAPAGVTIYLSGFYEKHSSPFGSHKPPSLTPNAPS
jgi:hypothetical protein